MRKILEGAWDVYLAKDRLRSTSQQGGKDESFMEY